MQPYYIVLYAYTQKKIFSLYIYTNTQFYKDTVKCSL